MPEGQEPKKPNKVGENLLSVLGQVANIASRAILGPYIAEGVDFSAPFTAGANWLKQSREEKGLLELLNSTPQTKALVEHGDALINAGGLVNNMDVAPKMLGIPEQFNQESEIPTNQPAQQPNLLNTIQQAPQQPVQPTQTQQTPIDFTSQEFLQKAAALRPDIAEKIITSKATSKESPLDTIKEMLQLQLMGKQISGFETPEEKRNAALQDKMTMLEVADKLSMGRTEQGIKLRDIEQSEKITPKEEEKLNEAEGLMSRYNTLAADVESGLTSNFKLGELILRGGQEGERIVQAINPQFSAAAKNIKEANALYQKFISGVAVSEPEAKRLATTQLQPTDAVEVQKIVLENNKRKLREALLINKTNIMKRMEQSGGKYRLDDEKDIKIYRMIRDKMNKDFSSSLKDPEIQRARKYLGIDYGVENIANEQKESK